MIKSSCLSCCLALIEILGGRIFIFFGSASAVLTVVVPELAGNFLATAGLGAVVLLANRAKMGSLNSSKNSGFNSEIFFLTATIEVRPIPHVTFYCYWFDS
jgi:hypothetical protein